MKMMSKTDCIVCDCYLEGVKRRIELCIEKMKGKYGTRRAVAHMEFCLSYIDDLTSDNRWVKSFYQQFRNPQNTPKSRRLGWHKKGANDEQK